MKQYSKITSFIFAALLACSGFTVFAQSEGAVEFADLSASYGEPKVEINLPETLIGFLAIAAQAEDPAVAAMLKELTHIKVRVYETKKDPKRAIASVDDITQKLKKRNWVPIVSVNEDKEKVRIYAKYSKDVMDGIVVMVVEEASPKSEIVFINIVGQIDPNNIAKITKRLNIDLGGSKMP